MNTPMDKMRSGFDGHPDETQLLLALERELSSEEAAEIDRHLGSCWSCRARSHELQRGILAFVEYREKRYLPSLEAPPQEFRDFPRQLRAAAADGQSAGILARLWRNLATRFTLPSQFRWAGAVATITAIVVIWSQVLNPPALSARELLTRAETFQNPQTPQAKAREVRKAHQKVRISDGRSEPVVRDFEWNVGGKIEQAPWQLQEDPSFWTAPLTAEGFANWRDSALTKEDKVIRSGEFWTLETTASGDAIKEARLVMRANDYHPVEQHIRFADDRQLDFEELSFDIRPQQISGPSQEAPIIAQSEAPKTSESVPETAVNLNDTELAVRYLMFLNHWDLDEDLQISRSPSQVLVGGTASSAEQAGQMQTSLGKLPNVRVSIEPPAAGLKQEAGPSSVRTTSATSVPLLRDLLDRSFVSTDERRAFVDRSLTASDDALARAWALKRLSDRYSPREEALLTDESRGHLQEMLHAHLGQLNVANNDLDALIELLPNSAVSEPSATLGWHAVIASLFNAVQQQDSLISALVVGTRSNGLDVGSASQRLRILHHAIYVLADRFASAEGPQAQ